MSSARAGSKKRAGSPEPLAGDGDRVVLGIVTRPHGVRGEVRVHRFNTDSTLMLELDRLLLVEHGVPREVRVLSRKRSGDADVLGLEGCTSPESAERLRGAEIAVLKRALPQLDDDEHYHTDLVGMRVLEKGREIGTVIAVQSYPASDVLRTRTERGVIEIPLLPPYVLGIDKTGRFVDVPHTEDFEPEPA